MPTPFIEMSFTHRNIHRPRLVAHIFTTRESMYLHVMMFLPSLIIGGHVGLEYLLRNMHKL